MHRKQKPLVGAELVESENGGDPNNPDYDTISTVSSTKSSVNLSTISGSGLLFLRNYMRKKKVRAPSQAEEQESPARIIQCSQENQARMVLAPGQQ